VLVILSKIDVTGSVLAQDLVVGGSGEGGSAEKEQMENQTQTEEIADGLILGFHVLDVDDFGGHVAGGAAPDEEILADVGELCQTEIGDHAVEVSLLPEEQILRFEVSMHDVFRVHFPQAQKNASDDELGLVGFEFVLGLDFVVELTALQQLENDVERVLTLEDLMEPHGVLVVQVPHDFDFLDQALLPLVLAVGGLLGECLDGIGDFIFKFFGQIDGGKVALADFLDGLELLVEASLVESASEDGPPLLDLLL